MTFIFPLSFNMVWPPLWFLLRFPEYGFDPTPCAFSRTPYRDPAMREVGVLRDRGGGLVGRPSGPLAVGGVGYYAVLPLSQP